METLGVGFPISPLIASCQKIVRTLNDIGKKFKRAPLMMTSIASECGLIHVALTQLRDFDWTSLAPESKHKLEPIIRATETIILGCTLTLSVIEEYAMELAEYVQGSKLSPTEQMGVMSRVRVFWKEDEMRELLVQLRGYQSGLTDLLRAAHDDSFSDDPDLTNVLNNFISLLHRSRNSRSKKPLSIRSAMQQSIAYTNMSRAVTPNANAINEDIVPPRTSSGSAPPILTTPPRQHNHGHSVSQATADLYDSATAATASRKAVTDKSRKKRPAFLALHSSDTDTQSEAARYAQSRKDREHLRRSSPTVGENFTFLETTSEPGDRNAERPQHVRTPSFSKNPSRTTSSRQGTRTPVQEDKDTNGEKPHNNDTTDDDLEDDLDGPPPPPSHTLTPQSEKLDPIREETALQPRYKKSSSSVRDQIIGLPEQARLRKQASGELSRQQREQDDTPTVPAVKTFQSPSKVASQELLKRRRQSDMTHKYQASDPTSLAYRPRRTAPRSASQDSRPSQPDSRAHPSGPLPEPPQEQIYTHGARSTVSHAAPYEPPSMQGEVPQHPDGAMSDNESWPFTAEMSQQPHAQAYLHSPSTIHSQHTFESRSYNSVRPLSPDATPRPSRSNTPMIAGNSQLYTPNRSRSRSNTGPTLTEDIEPSHLDDASSVAHSTAPSTMSAQWYRSPQERLGLGSKINRANAPPNWEALSHEEGYDDAEDSQTSRTRKVPMFASYLPKEQQTTKEQGAPDQPPRSPLLTDKFLTDVNGLPQDRQPEPPARTLSLNKLGGPRRMLSSRQGHRDAKDEQPSPQKKKKDSRFPSLGELVGEYKSLANKWYTSQESIQEIPERPSQESANPRPTPIDEEAPAQKKPSADTTFKAGLSRDSTSTDSRSAKSANLKSSAKSSKSAKSTKSAAATTKKKKKPSIFAEMRAEYKSLSNNWYQEAAAEADDHERSGGSGTRQSSHSGA